LPSLTICEQNHRQHLKPSIAPVIVEGTEISIVVPVYNSEATIVELVEGVRSAMRSIPDYAYEIILVNDCSTDDVSGIITNQLIEHGDIVLLNLSRNFGQGGALLAGWNHVRGDYVVNIDDDLQFDPHDIPRLISPLVDGYDVVYGVPISSGVRLGRRISTWMINRMYRSLFSVNHNRSAFSAVRRPIIDAVCENRGANQFLDGLIAWHTSNMTTVDIVRSKRKQGRSGHSFMSLLRQTFHILSNHSMSPLLIVAWLSFFLAIIGLMMSGTVAVLALINERTVPGWASLFVGITLFSSVQLLTLGMMSEYVARMHLRSNNEPQYFVRDKIDSIEEE